MWDPTTNKVVIADAIWLKWMYFTQPKDAIFDVKSTPPYTDAKDVEDVIGTNDGSDIEEVKDNKIQPTNQVQWANPIATTTVIESEAGEAVPQIASVT